MPEHLEVLVVGRANAHSQPDIEVPASEDTVGRRHAEITLGANGDCYLVDLGSANGTYVDKGGSWKKIQQSAVTPDTPIRLGTYETTIASLLRLRRRATPPPLPPEAAKAPRPSNPAGGRRPRRNPLTGEVE
jgi:pSer/pThr/pTyr-binding forkhead associated (FHA) protein